MQNGFLDMSEFSGDFFKYLFKQIGDLQAPYEYK